jgi:hypothetical protein
MTKLGPETVAGRATADSGLVLLDGPNGVAVAMTPEAARETGRRLIDAADTAEQQGTEMTQDAAHGG